MSSIIAKEQNLCLPKCPFLKVLNLAIHSWLMTNLFLTGISILLLILLLMMMIMIMIIMCHLR